MSVVFTGFGIIAGDNAGEIYRRRRAKDIEREIELAREGHTYYLKIHGPKLTAAFHSHFDHTFNVKGPAAIAAMRTRVDEIDAGIKAVRAAHGLHA